MNQQVKTEWVKALRSGEYEQTREKLRDNTGYCCLGVLCDLYAKATGDTDWRFDEESNRFTLYETGELPPVQVRDWAGLKDLSPKITRMESNECLDDLDTYDDEIPVDVELIELNDDEGMDFKQIADLIEEQL